MMILNKDGMLVLDGSGERVGCRTKLAIEMPADLLEQQSDLLDRVLAFAFEVLELRTLDLRVRPHANSLATPGARPGASGSG